MVLGATYYFIFLRAEQFIKKHTSINGQDEPHGLFQILYMHSVSCGKGRHLYSLAGALQIEVNGESAW
jgi:hypothetical protein